MKIQLALFAFALAPLPALAGTLDCAGSRLAYSYDATDGGAPRDPYESLVYDGQVLVHAVPFGESVRLAAFSLTGSRQVLKTVKSREYVLTTFESAATARKNGEDTPFFSGTVVCRENRYVGPPRP